MAEPIRDSGLSLNSTQGTANSALFFNSKNKVVEAPAFAGLVADTHAHIDMQEDPALSLACAGAVGLGFIGVVVDVCEQAELTYRAIPKWITQAQTYLQDMLAREAAGEICGILAPNPVVPHMRITVGCHPHNSKDFTPQVEELLYACAANPQTSCIGEIGLDYYYDESPREDQKRVFARQINMAKEMDLPIAMHIRDAHADALEILHREGMPSQGAILHCFTSDVETLKPFLDLDCYVAFGGAMTFKKSEDIREAAKIVPANRLLLETDSPFMAPEPLRGTTCTPAHTIFTAARLAEIRGTTAEELLASTYTNAVKFLNKDVTLWQLEHKDNAAMQKLVMGE